MTSNHVHTQKIPFNILYVEDNDITRENTAELLQECASKVITAIDAEDAYNKFQNKSIHVIITDLKMPRAGGMSLIKKIRETHKKIPIIIISAYSDIEALHDSIDTGVKGYILKPINIPKLMQLLEEIKVEHENSYLKISSRKKLNTNNFLVYSENKLIDVIDSFKSSVVVLIKIEEFKYLNSSMTSKISKKLQKRFAKRLFSHMPERCNFPKIYLLERGEFVFVKPYLQTGSKENFHKEIKAFQERVNNAKIKIGLVDYTLSIITSLAYGENALENAKAGLENLLESKHGFIVATELLEKEKEEALKKLQTFRMLRKAINTYNIVSYFQPIVNNKTRKIEKYESLVRLIDEEHNIVSPYFFLDVAKEGKYYQEITSIVLRNSFRALFDTDMEISINLSALDIVEEQTREEFFLLVEKYKTDTHRITVELVEDDGIDDINVIQDFIEKIKAKGVKIAIDDFGKGFSNFSRVLTYRPNYIKIDGTLIRDIETNNLTRNMVETIVYFSKKQGIQTIAEYVENENIYNILCALGVDYSQGYYFGKAEILKRDIY